MADDPLLDARQVEQVADQGNHPLGLFLGPGENVMILLRRRVHQVADYHGQLLVNGRQRGSQFMRHLGHEFRLEPIQDLHGRDVDKIQYGPQTLLSLSQNGLSPGAQVGIGGQGELVVRNITVIDVLSPGNLHHELAQGFVLNVVLDLAARPHIGVEIQQVLAGGVDQNDLAAGIGDQNPIRQGFDDGPDSAFFGIQIRQGACFFLFELSGVPGQTDFFSRAIDDDAQLIRLERLGDKVIGPLLHGRDGRFDRGVTGDDDNQYPLIHLTDVLENLHAVHTGHLQVEQHDGGMDLLDDFQCHIAAVGGVDNEADALENSLRAFPNVPLIVHHQNTDRIDIIIHFRFLRRLLAQGVVR